MHFVALFAVSGAAFAWLLIDHSLIRIKHIQAARILATLEWLASYEHWAELGEIDVGDEEPDPIRKLARAIGQSRETARSCDGIYELSFRQYVSVLRRSPLKYLLWANRLAGRLESATRSPLPAGIPARWMGPDQGPAIELLASYVSGFVRYARAARLRASDTTSKERD